MPLEVSGEKQALSPAEREERFVQSLKALQDRIGYQFKNPKLLAQAMTAPDYAQLMPLPSASNAMLESAGDRLIRQTIEKWIKASFPDSKQAYFLDHLLNSNAYFATIGMSLKLDECVRIAQSRRSWPDPNRPEESFAEHQQRMTSDALEALAAALFQDGGTPALTTFVHKHLLSEKNHFLTDLVKLTNRKDTIVCDTFRTMTNGRGDITYDVIRQRDGKDVSEWFAAHVSFDGEQIRFENGRLDRVKADAARYAAMRFFINRPWHFWGFDGPTSLTMPQTATAATATGSVEDQSQLIYRPNTGQNGNGWFGVIPPGEKGYPDIAQWKPIALDRIKSHATMHEGPSIDQLRFELARPRVNQTLTVRAPIPNPALEQDYAFFANNRYMGTIRRAHSMHDAANKMLAAYRATNGIQPLR